MTTPAPEVPATGTPDSSATTDQGATPDDQGQQQQDQKQTDPADELAKWKKQARDNEKRAKENAAAAAELAKIKEGQKSDNEKAAEAAAQARREADEAKAEAVRWRVAAVHHVSEENFDLLGTGTEEEITERAKRVGALEAAKVELDQLKAQQDQNDQASQKPGAIPGLRPGSQPQVPDTSYPTGWFPQLQPRNQDQRQT